MSGVRLKVLDFGLAKLTLPVGAESRRLTVAGSVMGTLAYMAPEQLSGQTVDERADIFSLGVTVVEAILGRNPFRAGDSTRIVAAILHEPVSLPGEEPEVRALDAALQKCLAKDRQGRFMTVADMQRDLIPALRACPPLAAAGPPDPEAATATRG